MNYSDWMKNSFTRYEEAGSAETYSVIRQALKETVVHRLIIWTAVLVTGLLIFENIGAVFSASLFQGPSGFLLAFLAFFTAYCVTEPLNKLLVKRRIRHLAQQE